MPRQLKTHALAEYQFPDTPPWDHIRISACGLWLEATGRIDTNPTCLRCQRISKAALKIAALKIAALEERVAALDTALAAHARKQEVDRRTVWTFFRQLWTNGTVVGMMEPPVEDEFSPATLPPSPTGPEE